MGDWIKSVNLWLHAQNVQRHKPAKRSGKRRTQTNNGHQIIVLSLRNNDSTDFHSLSPQLCLPLTPPTSLPLSPPPNLPSIPIGRNRAKQALKTGGRICKTQPPNMFNYSAYSLLGVFIIIFSLAPEHSIGWLFPQCFPLFITAMVCGTCYARKRTQELNVSKHRHTVQEVMFTFTKHIGTNVSSLNDTAWKRMRKLWKQERRDEAARPQMDLRTSRFYYSID